MPAINTRPFKERTERLESDSVMIRNSLAKAVLGTEKQFDAIDERFDLVDERFDAVDERINAVESNLSERIGGGVRIMASASRKTNARIDALDAKFDG